MDQTQNRSRVETALTLRMRRSMLALLLLAAHAGCSTVPGTGAPPESGQAAASAREDSARDRGSHLTAALKCGWQGARGAVETARFLSVFALPLVPIMAVAGMAEGASKGEAARC
jgi:hypothetical protein